MRLIFPPTRNRLFVVAISDQLVALYNSALGAWGEHANSTQKGPFADPIQGMGTDDMEEQTHHTVPTVSSAGN